MVFSHKGVPTKTHSSPASDTSDTTPKDPITCNKDQPFQHCEVWSLHPGKAPWCIQLVLKWLQFWVPFFWGGERVWFWLRLLRLLPPGCLLSDFGQMKKRNVPTMYMIHAWHMHPFTGFGWRAKDLCWQHEFVLNPPKAAHQRQLYISCFWKENVWTYLNVKQFERRDCHRFINKLVHLYCPSRHAAHSLWNGKF